MNGFALRQSAKALAALLLASAGLYLWLVIAVGGQLHQASGDIVVRQQILGLTFLQGQRVGQVSMVQRGLGFALLVVLPFLVAAAVYALAARRRG